MLDFDAQKCLTAIRQADKDELIDQVTAYRPGMEPEAIEMIEGELRRRGVSDAEVEARAEDCRSRCLFDASGVAIACSRCRRPAVTEVIGWHRLFGRLPLFPRKMRYCDAHRPAAYGVTSS
jgi:hypothetical protein